jgi:hypothetical protein
MGLVCVINYLGIAIIVFYSSMTMNVCMYREPKGRKYHLGH